MCLQVSTEAATYVSEVHRASAVAVFKYISRNADDLVVVSVSVLCIVSVTVCWKDPSHVVGLVFLNRHFYSRI